MRGGTIDLPGKVTQIIIYYTARLLLSLLLLALMLRSRMRRLPCPAQGIEVRVRIPSKELLRH